MGVVGINVAGRGEYAAPRLATSGVRLARFVAYPDYDARAYIAGLRAAGIEPLVVLASEWMGSDDAAWPAAVAAFGRRYGGVLRRVQAGNEPDAALASDLDGDGTVTLSERMAAAPSSWVMEPERLNHFLRLVRAELPGWEIVGPGLCSGQPSWLAQIDLAAVDTLALHCYAKEPGSPDLETMVAWYAAYGKPLWATEHHARTRGLTAYLAGDERFVAAVPFCWSDQMVAGFGALEDPAALADLRAAAAGHLAEQVRRLVPMEEHDVASYQLGIAEKAKALGEAVVGKPLQDEEYVSPTFAVQMSEKGLFVYSKRANKVHFLPAR